mmetsp:Transcript_548/g.1392  ORF Transcript_548/g.1392 Transcript_548/m.1392 type:complete len:1117 (-) Transcript_548:95-3445(-)|eukprot:CAMPEP_0171577308 /NCGR_PEP_ID=MMETSP0961-20121227/7150_1 /TAXON_ID=87120 /ORGANISM="Aurantiochytrium limacinum, Strain ATCCMYA-1381" /LENGTH=1116 /DNA_ID=CAMNT_0012133339 /DNA_START=22 /DNA_END=3372 /DNA_ORIENTATION=+
MVSSTGASSEVSTSVGGSRSGLLFSRRPSGLRDGGRFAVVNAGDRGRFIANSIARRGALVIAATHRGDLFAIHALSGAFRRLSSLAPRPDVIAIAPGANPREILVGLQAANGALRIPISEYDDGEGATQDSAELRGHSSTVCSVAYHPSGSLAATASAERVILWETENWRRVKSLGGGGLGVVQVVFTGRGDLVLVAFRNGSVLGWGAHEFELLVRLQTQEEAALSCIAVSPDSKYVVGGAPGKLFVWELRTQALIRVIELPSQVTAVVQIKFAEDDFKVLVLGDDGVVRVLQVLGRGDARSVMHIATDVAVSFDVSGSIVAICTSKGELTLHDLDAADKFTSTRNTRRPFVMDTRGVIPAQTVRRAEKLVVDDTTSGYGQEPRTPPLVRLARNLNKQDKSLNAQQLQRTLEHFGEFPEKYRTLVWRFLLRLPENADAYANLTRQGPHPAWANSLYERFPVKSRKVFSRLERVLFAFAHWCPVFEETSYLPAMAYPFVRLYEYDELAAFETVMLILFRCCGHWFESFPHMPVFVLARVEKLLEIVDPSLLEHLVEREISSGEYAWPMLRSLFSEVLDKRDWLRLWDHIVMQMHKDFSREDFSPSWFLEAAVVSYLRYFRNSILSLRRKHDLEGFFRRPNPIDARRWIKTTMALCRGTKYRSFWESFEEKAYKQQEGRQRDDGPRILPCGNTYPAFQSYPRFTVDYESQERKRIAAEEALLAERRDYVEDLRKKTAELEEQEQSYKRLQEQLLKQEDKRRAEQTAAQEKRLQEKEKLDRATRLRRLERIEKMEDLAKDNLSLQQQLRQAEAARTQAELDHQERLRELEMQAHREEERIQALETDAALKLQKIHAERLLEQEMQDVRLSSARMTKQGELDWRLKEHAWKVEDEKMRIERELKSEQSARDARLKEISLARRQLESKFSVQQMESQLKIAALERERQVRTFKQDVSQTFHQDLDKKLEAERLLAEEEQRAKSRINDQYKSWTEGVAAERAQLLADERRKALRDAQQRDMRLEMLQQEQNLRDFELQAERKIRETRLQLDKEEQELQDQLLALDEQRRSDQAVEDELLRKQHELELKHAYVRSATDRETRRIRGERSDLTALREELEDDEN